MTAGESSGAHPPLDDAAIARLRSLDEMLGAAGPSADLDVVALVGAIESMAQRTPAWLESYVALLDRLIAGAALLPAGNADHPQTLDRVRSALDAASRGCPQVVGVELTEMAFTRAEWVAGNLHLGLSPAIEDAGRFCYFRVVGAEPRMWDVHGVSNVRIESTMSGLNVRVPLVRADMSLIRSSY